MDEPVDQDAVVVVLSHAGQRLELDLLGVTAVETRDYRAAVRVSFSLVRLKALARQPFELEEVAGLLWLLRRRADPFLAYDTVAHQVTLRSLT
jgi:hypothetical protein